MTWTNKDGLVVRFADENAVEPKASNEFGTLQRLVVKMTDASVLNANNADPMTAAAQAAYRDETTPFIPARSYVTRAYFVVTTAFAGASGELDIGLMTAAGAIIDVDFFDDAIAVTAIDAAYDVVNCNGAGVGGVVTTGATDAYVCFTEHASNAFTAGAGYLVVEYMPATDIIS